MLMPMSYHLMYVRGLIHEVKHEFEDARQCYENSLAINPSHVSSLHHLAKVYYQLGYNRLAEQTLKIAVRIDPASEDLWSLLGQVTEALASDFLCQGNQPLESSLSRHGSQSDNEASEEDDYEDYSGPNETASIDLRNLKVESEATPTEETVAGFNSEAAKLFEMAAEFHSIALSVHSSSPIVPFSSIPLAFE
jgi:tetratricopeptide (TPR) repeat protein